MQLRRFKQIAGDQSHRLNMWGRTVVTQTRAIWRSGAWGRILLFFFFALQMCENMFVCTVIIRSSVPSPSLSAID